MSKEAMKLALEGAANYIDALGGDSRKYRQTLANEALDKKAENARELGLDYEPAQQEPVAWMEMVVANLVREGVNKHKARELAQHFYTSPPAQQEPAIGKGKEFSERLKLCARNVAFVASGRVDMSSAAMQEMFALIDHVCVGIDFPQPAQQDSTCNNTLRAQGKAYTRTCKKCGKGPCIADRVQPEQERPSFAEWTSDHVRDNLHKLKPEQEQWDAIPDAFNEWWNADYDDTGNPYRKDSPAYWAWSGWKAASKQPEQEPVAWVCNGTNSHHDIDFFEEDVDSLSVGTQLYTSPPAQRTWVALTDEEMFEAIRQLYSSDKVARLAVSHSKDEYRAIEAKLKEKNT